MAGVPCMPPTLFLHHIVIKEQQSLLLFEVHDVSVRQAFWERKKKKEAVLCNLNIPLVASDPSGISTTILQSVIKKPVTVKYLLIVFIILQK